MCVCVIVPSRLFYIEVYSYLISFDHHHHHVGRSHQISLRSPSLYSVVSLMSRTIDSSCSSISMSQAILLYRTKTKLFLSFSPYSIVESEIGAAAHISVSLRMWLNGNIF